VYGLGGLTTADEVVETVFKPKATPADLYALWADTVEKVEKRASQFFR
jgi:hypothetical protein